jgi:hypothetical protein
LHIHVLLLRGDDVGRLGQHHARPMWRSSPWQEARWLACGHCGAELAMALFAWKDMGEGVKEARCSHRCLKGYPLEGSGHAVRRAVKLDGTARTEGR